MRKLKRTNLEYKGIRITINHKSKRRNPLVVSDGFISIYVHYVPLEIKNSIKYAQNLIDTMIESGYMIRK